MKNFCKLFGIYLSFIAASFASDLNNKFDYYVTRSCKLDKNGSVKAQPENFNLSNNLISNINSPSNILGKIFILTGKIVDINCVPISDAKINIWQADSYGVMDDATGSKKNNVKLQDSFYATGTANSDNLGLFHFVTIIPNYFKNKNGEIFLKITLEEMGEYYKTININEKMLEKNDLYLLYPDQNEKYSSLPQYKFIWTLEVTNNFVNY